MKFSTRYVFLITTALAWLTIPVPSLTLLAADDGRGEQLFVRRIAPLLAEKCLACHGKDNIEGGLDLRSRVTSFQGGDSDESTIVENSPDESPLILAVVRADAKWSPMPPKEAESLTKEQIGWLREWIALGATWPDDARRSEIASAGAHVWAEEDGAPVKTSGGLSDDWSQRKYNSDSLWCYQPIKLNGDLKARSIDDFVSERMPEGLSPASACDARTFIRRASFDLTGLPPTPEEIASFELAFGVDDDAAVRSLIERLLASPHYGERMAQHWLDVTRYADSSGFANDYERGNAWRYRDYVVRAFNDDKPYDQFIIEQIAGDEIEPNNPENIIATGFLRMGPWELTGMEVAKVARQRFLDDVVNSVGETFLAQSLQCARCHDHKFDPVPTRDYYSIQAVFATTQLVERSAPFLAVEKTHGFSERVYLEKTRYQLQATLVELDDVLLENSRIWFTQNGKDSTKWDAAVKNMQSKASTSSDKVDQNDHRRFSDVFAAARRALAKEGIAEGEYPPKLVGFTPEQFGRERVARKGLERLQWELERYEPYALAVYSGRTPDRTSVAAPLRMPEDRLTTGELEKPCIHLGGDPFAEGPEVKPGVLSVIDIQQSFPIPENIEGRRLAFARWTASAENPLTTRAIVNRIWMWHFNQPIAGNPNNFGSTGKSPTHPELLDWLAWKFVEQGWSFKTMHRLIMNSGAYRRSGTHPDLHGLRQKDPLGISYAVFKPRRLTAEELRDAMLSASGELNPTIGGIPNRPEINIEAALQPRQVMGTFAAAWVPNPRPEQRNRRSLYALKLRGLSDPAMDVFNAPSPDFSCERRETSTVTPQVYALFNSKASSARALALADRVLRETSGDDAAIERCFALVLGRSATPQELVFCREHWREMEIVQSSRTVLPWMPSLEVRREAIEENTGERFSFDEKLYANADYVPDLQPADCSAHTRALADVCLALLNTNEFAYVY